jgi:type IV pilus biogenesis protein CpaD/CtpE
MTPYKFLLAAVAAGAVAACTPTVKLEAPDKPIEINLNVKVQQEVRIRVEKELEQDILSNPELFGLPATTPKKSGGR